MLRVRSLCKSFDGRLVLDHITLDVPQNQFVCLLGGSGCGKTTLLRIIAGLTRADDGRLESDGKEIHGPGQDRSLVFQNYGLLPWRDVQGNVEFGLEFRQVSKSERRRIACETIERVGLKGFERHFPHQISGGMQQRVALARAFAKKPNILLMDEPFAAVDMQTREQMQEELLTIWTENRTTVLFVTHSIEEAIYLADRVIVMGAHPGHVKADVMTGLPRPRDAQDVRTSTRFAELQRQFREALRPDQRQAS
jgi:NitT/TauT family transport system ATP-binding protein